MVTESRLIHFPLPLRSDLMAYLVLPPDITAGEAARVARYVKALVVVPETTSGPTAGRTA